MQDTGPGNGKNAGWYETWAFGSVADAWTVPGALARLANTWTAPGALARLADIWTAPGSLARLADIWTAPGSLARLPWKKFLRFLNSQELFLRKANRDTPRLFLPHNLT